MRRELRAHQTEAYERATAALSAHSRTNVVMACGSGKTLVGMRIAEYAARILMLEPSLALIRQALEEARADGLLDGRTVICVCSDKTLASADHWKVADEELGLPVTTDSATLRQLLNESGPRCAVFCTYQSQPLLRDSLPSGFYFDFGNFDEAHRTAGFRDRTFSVALSDDQIRIEKRLFLTATPRLFVEPDDETNDSAYSMDDEITYGPRAFELTLASAIDRGIVCDYQVLTACVAGSDVQEALKRANDLLLPQKKLPVELVAGQIAVVRAIQSTAARRVITFHATIDEAASFTKDRLRLYRDAGITAFHIHGDMPGRQRQAVINAFLSVDGPALLTNCHCLTEGVDVPEIDMVGIMCRKESVQELVQAVGRALRNRPGKERGYVMLPLYVDENEPMDSALNRSDMGVTWEILHSVLEDGGALSDKLVHCQQHRTGDSPVRPYHHRGHLRVVASDALFDDLQRAISVRHIHRLAARWEVMLEAAARYFAREGSLAMPLDHFEDELPLGRWVAKQRQLRQRGRLPTHRLETLAALGFLWDTREAKWAAGLKLAREFKALHGHLHVPPTATALHTWLKAARNQMKNADLQTDKRQALIDLDISPQCYRSGEERLLALENWRQNNPTGRPARKGPDSALAFFISNAIARYRAGTLAESTIERLARINIDVRSIPAKRLTGHQQFGEQSWDMHYQALKTYLDLHGWSGLWRTKEFEGLSIGTWVNHQRLLRHRGQLPIQRFAALDLLGIQWNRKGDWWIVWVERLEAYQREHGHLRLPNTREFAALKNHVTIIRRRLCDNTMPADAAQRLRAIDFPRTAEDELTQWAHHTLSQWRQAHGPDAFSRPDIPSGLMHFLAKRKRLYKRGQLPEAELEQLRKLGVTWATLDPLHSRMVARLTSLARELGKANVEAMASQQGDLGEWLDVQIQAAARGELSQDIAKDLRRLGIDIGEGQSAESHERQSERAAV